MLHRAVATLALLLAAGCGTMVVDGITVREASYLETKDRALALGEADLSCPRDQLTARVVGVHPSADVNRMEVEGCGKSAIYVGTGEMLRAEEDGDPRPES